MTVAAEPRLLQEFFRCEKVGILDKTSQAALRLCSKQIKDYVDATINACEVKPSALHALRNCNWPLTEIKIATKLEDRNEPRMPPASFTSLLHDLISKFPLLETLQLDAISDLQELPGNIGDLSKLKWLGIYRAYLLEALPPSFGQLATLEALQLTSCDALTLDGLGPLKHLTQLKHLEMHGVVTREPLFLDWLCSCDFPLLEHLGLSDGLLTTLEKLSIFSPSDEESIAPLQHLTGLTGLNLSRFRVEDDSMDYPDFLWNLSLLKTLNLRACGVGSLPDALGNLKNLEVLKLEDLNFIRELPESIGTLSCLTKLNIGHCCRLKSLPESIGNLAALKFLTLNSCSDLDSLPESFGNLKNLQILKIWKCDELSQLPSSIGSLGSLEHLIVGRCEQLHRLPDSIGNLNALKVLSIDRCPILHIPDSFGNLVLDRPYEDWSLQQVWVSGCDEMVLSQRTEQALTLLKQHGVWKPNA